MEILCKSDYQDVYRVTDGVLLIVQKFRYVFGNGRCMISTYKNPRDSTIYANGCQDQLRVLKKSRNSDIGMQYPPGTVVYNGYIIEKCPPYAYEFQIKTTGDMCIGDADSMLEILKEITEKIGEYNK